MEANAHAPAKIALDHQSRGLSSHTAAFVSQAVFKRWK